MSGRWAVSLPVFLLIVPFGLLVAVERESQLNPSSTTTNSVMIAASGFFISFLYIFVAQATLLKDRKVRHQPLRKCFFVWYSTGLVQGLAAASYAHFAFGLDWDFATRLTYTTFYIGTALALVSFYFGSIERRRVEDQALQSLEQLLAVDKGEMVTADARARGEALAVLQNVLKPQIEKLQGLIQELRSSSGAKAAELAGVGKEIASAIDTEANAVARSRVSNSENGGGKRKKISMLSGIFPHFISVRISVFLIAFGSLTGQIPRNGLKGALAGLTGALLIGIVLVLLSRIVKRNQGENRRLFILLSYLIVFITQSIWTYLQKYVGFVLDRPYNPFYSATKTIYGVYVASIIASLVVDTSRSREKSRDGSEKIRQEIAILAREQELLENHLHATRFGTLQGKISGVIMALQLIDSTSSKPELSIKRESLIENANTLLNDALKEIEDLGRVNEK